MWSASARAHVHTSFERWCLLARSSIADQGVILVDKCCNSSINVIWLCSPDVVVPSYIKICPPYRDLVVGHIHLLPGRKSAPVNLIQIKICTSSPHTVKPDWKTIHLLHWRSLQSRCAEILAQWPMRRNFSRCYAAYKAIT